MDKVGFIIFEIRALSSRSDQPSPTSFVTLRRDKNAETLKTEMLKSAFLQVTSKTRECVVKKVKKMRRDSVSPFRDKLWNLFKELAKGVDGADVVVALKQAGEEIWAVGIDETYSDMSQRDQEEEPLGNAFDISWLTVVCIKLKEMKQGKKPKVRIHA